MKNVILIVANNASRTGAPILLLNLLQWIKKQSTLRFIFILDSGGELLDDYKSLGEVFLLGNIKRPVYTSKPIKQFLYKAGRKIFKRNDQFYTTAFIKKLSRQHNIQLVLSNTAINGALLGELKKLISAKIITYVHEGERLLDVNSKTGTVSKGLQVSDIIIAVSDSVKQVLINKFQVTIPIQIITGAIDINNIKINSGAALPELDHIPSDTIKIMACGYPVWQKGTDYFIQIANKLCKSRSDVHFIWLGGTDTDEGFSQMLYDIEKLNLTKRVTLITTKQSAIDYINCVDIFFVLSRNESFSLVTAEAGFCKKPVLCFDKAGGPCEIVDFKPEFIVPYAAIDDMCEKINLLSDNPALRLQMGTYLNERVKANYIIDKSAGELLGLITELI